METRALPGRWLLARAASWSCDGALLPLLQLLSYGSVVEAAQQKSESGFKSAQEGALAVQAVFIAQTAAVPYLLCVETS